ncbi:MAG: MFS transporter [Halieaceae bacterium]
MASARSTLYAVMLVSLLGTAGIALPYPVLSPFFLQAESSNALTHFMGLPPKILLGIILALYPLGILIGSSFIGALSDLYGRKRVLIISLLAAAAGYGLTGYAVAIENYPLFALARFLTGICEGNIAISRAIALELHPTIDRTRAISLLYATTYAGWLVGPLAGGYLMPLGVANVFLATAAMTLLATALVNFAIVNQARQDDASATSVWQVIASNNSIGLLRVSAMQPLIFYHFLFTLGLNAFYEFYPLWLVERFGFDSIRIGWGTVVITLAMIISSLYAVAPMESRFGPMGTVRIGSLTLALVFMLLPLAGPQSLYPAFLACGAIIAVTNGVFPAYMANNFEQYGLGRVQGLLTTNFCFANVIAALAGSAIALLGTGWSLFSGGLLCGLASLWLWSRRQPQQLPKQLLS